MVPARSTFAGQAAFAISIDSGTGVVTVEQYLSLRQDSLSGTPDDTAVDAGGPPRHHGDGRPTRR